MSVILCASANIHSDKLIVFVIDWCRSGLQTKFENGSDQAVKSNPPPRLGGGLVVKAHYLCKE